MNNTFLLCYAPKPRSQVTESVLIYQNWFTVNSRLADNSLWRTLAITDKIQTPSKSCGGLTAEMTPAITDSRYYGIKDSFSVPMWQFCCFDSRYWSVHAVLPFIISVKIHFKRFPECFFSHRFLKLCSQSSSLLHLRFFSSRLFRIAQVLVLVFHSQRLRLSSVRYCWYVRPAFQDILGSHSTFISHYRALDSKTSTTTSTRFNLGPVQTPNFSWAQPNTLN